mgnify:CR=1 FL=1
MNRLLIFLIFLVVSAVDGLPALTFFGWQLDLAWFGYLLAWLGVSR